MTRRSLALRTLLAVVLLLCAAAPWWVRGMGTFLVHAEPAEPADAVVVLAGDWMGLRILKGADLVRSGFAPRVLMSSPVLGFYGQDEGDLAVQYAVRKGYPRESFDLIPHHGMSTRTEADAVAAEVRRRGIRRLLVVTSDYHTRRTSRIYRQALPGVRLRVVAADDAFYRPGRWWDNRESRKRFLLEWTKLLTDLVGL